jgi:hypothetical protein
MTDRQNNSSSILPSFKSCVPKEFLLVLEAVSRLEEGIWVDCRVSKVKQASVTPMHRGIPT